MDEAKRFFRYVIPGLVCGIETWFLLMLLNQHTFFGISIETGIGDISDLLTVVVVSGGVGFLLSLIWHVLYNLGGGWLMPDFTKIINNETTRQCLTLRKEDKTNGYKVLDTTELVNKRGAWMIISVIGYINKDTFPERYHNRCDELHNTLHGIGAALVGSIISPLLVLVACWWNSPVENVCWWNSLVEVFCCFDSATKGSISAGTRWFFWWVTVIGLVSLCKFNYCNVRKTIQEFIEKAHITRFYQFLYYKTDVIVISNNDIKKSILVERIKGFWDWVKATSLGDVMLLVVIIIGLVLLILLTVIAIVSVCYRSLAGK